MAYTLTQIAQRIGAQIFGEARGEIKTLLTDSRSLAFPETTLFFALRTRTGDGHRYIEQLYQKGVRAFVVGVLPEEAKWRFPQATFLVCAAPLQALQLLAESHRRDFNLPVVGITGSNGKTIVKEWLYQLLGHAPGVTRSPRSYNSQVGVPLSVWLLHEGSELGIFEAGISQPREMVALRHIVRPTTGIITNIGPAHQEYFATLEEKCLEKLNLFKHAERLVYPADDPIIAHCLPLSGFGGERIGWSRRHPEADYPFSTQVGETTTRITDGRSGEVFTIPFTDNASIDNAITAFVAIRYTDVPSQLVPTTVQLEQRMRGLQSVAMRLEVKAGVRGITLIDDAFNADLASLDIALDFLARRRELQPAVLILSDLQQTGEDQALLYQKVAQLVACRKVDRVIGVGQQLVVYQHLFGAPTQAFPTTQALRKSGVLDTLSEALVLLKGARSFHFESLAEELQLKVHETTLGVDLGALGENLRHYRSFMQPSTRMVCMVKAGGYGNGSIEVARTLQDLGVDYLAVAVADEGVELRKAGITAGILIMNPEMSVFPTLFKYRLEPEIYNFRLLDALIAAARQEGELDFPVHIKLDTGMCRLGFHPEKDLDALIARLHQQQAVRPRSIFSHFVGSDSADFDDFSAQQFSRFDHASLRFQQAFSTPILRHICNSAAIERFPQRHLNMVRLGIGLYGVDPISNRVLHNVATLRTTILQIREIEAETSVGYSRRTIVDRPSRIAAIPIGYADGLDRHLGNRRGYAIVNGQPAPYVGNICMDVCMIDVTDIPCREGDEVEIFGEQLPLAKVAEWLGTIPYEILTSVSSRVKRVYYQ